jgi:hypothetical protein
VDPANRIVTTLPLTELRDATGNLVEASRGRDLDSEAIRELLRAGPVQFVIADLGSSLTWIPRHEGFNQWKSDIHRHLYRPELPYLENYRDGYFYTASEWHLVTGESVIVLEQHH